MQLRKFTSKIRIIVLLSIVLLTEIAVVPTLQIAVQGQAQRQQSPPPPGTISPPSSIPAPPPSETISPPSETTSSPTPPIIRRPTTSPALDTAGEAVNQSAMVMIPQSSVMMMLSNLQIAMNAVEDDEDAIIALESVYKELRNAANAAGMSVETTAG